MSARDDDTCAVCIYTKLCYQKAKSKLYSLLVVGQGKGKNRQGTALLFLLSHQLALKTKPRKDKCKITFFKDSVSSRDEVRTTPDF
jgi:hypothetical protein